MSETLIKLLDQYTLQSLKTEGEAEVKGHTGIMYQEQGFRAALLMVKSILKHEAEKPGYIEKITV